MMKYTMEIVIVWHGQADKNCMYLYIPYKCKVEKPITLMALIIEMECACGSMTVRVLL